MTNLEIGRQNITTWVKKYWYMLITVSVVLFVVIVLALYVTSKNQDTSNLVANTITVNTNSKTEGNSNTATTKDLNNDNIVNWTKSISASNNDVPMDGVIIDEIKPGQVYNGNLNLPKGWTAEYSTDAATVAPESRTYSSSEPSDLTTVRFIRITTGEADGFKPYTSAPLVQPLDARQLITDGNRPLAPIIFNDKVFQIIRGVRATGTSYYTMDCFDLTTYQRCSEVVFPTYFSTSGTSASPTALGTGARNISTAYNMQPVLEDDLSSAQYGRLYFPGQSGNSYGVTCVDLINFTNCGFTILGTSAEPLGVGNPATLPYNPVLISGFVKKGTKLYGHANDADRLYQTAVCFDISTGASCSGFSQFTNMNSSIPTYYIAEHENSYGTPGTHVMVGDKLYWLVNYRVGNTRLLGFFIPEPQRDLGTRLACFDTVSKATCSGWTTPIVNTSGFGIERPLALYVWKKPGTATVDYAVCFSWGLGSGVDPVQSCRNPDSGAAYGGGGNNVSFPGIFPQQWLLTPWTVSQYITTITDESGHLKSYFPIYKTGDNNTTALELNATPSKGATICYDWNTQSLCSGFPATKYWHDINNGYSGDVGYAYDGSCMWAVGYSGHIWSYNASTGETPCRVARTKYNASFNAADYYCDATNRAFKWGKARLSKSSMYDFQSFDMVVKNANGDIVKSENIKNGSNTIDLSDLTYSQGSPLTVEVNSSVYNTSPWANGGLPYINIVANAEDYANNVQSTDDVEYCYQTKVKDQCDIANVQTTTSATIMSPTDTIIPGEKNQTIPVNQPANEQCFRDLRVGVSASTNLIKNSENVTYSINVENKANTDPEQRGNIPNQYNPSTARVEATLPSGVTFISATDNGTLQGNKVVWENQSIAAASIITRNVTIKAPESASAFNNIPSKTKVYAATTQLPLELQVAVIYDDDTFESDNTVTNSSVTFINETFETPIEGGGGNEGGNNNGGGGETPTTPTTPPATPVTPDNIPEQPDLGNVPDNNIPQAQSIINPTSNVPRPTAIARLLAVPERVGETLGAVITVSARAVKPIPPSVARAVPYTTISLIIIIAVFYFYQAYNQTKSQLILSSLAKRFKKTKENRKNYVDLTSHYISTPITTMSSTIELQESLHAIPAKVLEKAKKAVVKLREDSLSLLTNSQRLSDDSSRVAQTLDGTINVNIFKNPAFVVSLIGVLFIVLVSNVVFIRADKYSASIVTFVLQTSFFLLAVGSLVAGYSAMKKQKHAYALANKEFKLEQEINSAQSKFIADSSAILAADVALIDSVAPEIVNAKHGDNFKSGLKSLKKAVSKLAYLNQLSAGTIKKRSVSVNLKTLADEVFSTYQPIALQSQINLRTDIDSKAHAMVDSQGFKYILISLLDNAIKFTKPGGDIKVTIKSLNKRFATLTVQDTGAGIPKDKIDTLFAPFSRGTDTLKFNYQGLGLDLYMDKLISEQAGGTISISSIEGAYTTVSVKLPKK